MPWKKPGQERQRWEFCEAVKHRAPRSFATWCRQFGISRRVGYKWLARAHESAREGWQDRSHQPQHTKALAQTWRVALLAASAAQPLWGARKLQWQLRQDHPGRLVPSIRTLHRWRCAAGVVVPRRMPRPGPWRVAPALIRGHRPNEVWTLDFKGFFRTGDGTRIHALTVCDQYSHFVLAVVHLKRPTAAAVKRVFQRLFRTYGKPRALLMDRGAPWCGIGPYNWTHLSVWWLRLDIWPQFTRRATPQDNAAHEQMHRMLKAATARPAAPSVAAQQRRFARWRAAYNHRRPHAALGEVPPGSAYQAGAPLDPTALQVWRYPAHYTSLHVTRCGFVRWRGQIRSIGRAFHSHPIGLRDRRDGSALVYLGPHLIGQLCPNELTLRPVITTSVQRGRG